MIHFNSILKFTTVAAIIILLFSCSEDNDSIFYKIDPDAIPEIVDTVEADSRIIENKIICFDQYLPYTTDWDKGKGLLFAVLDSTLHMKSFDTSSTNIIAKGEIDTNGYSKITLPSRLAPEHVVYAKDKYKEFEIESNNLITNKCRLQFIVWYRKDVWGIPMDRFENLSIVKEVSNGNYVETNTYSYEFFTEESAIAGENKDGNNSNIQTKKGWTIVETSYKGNKQWHERYPYNVHHVLNYPIFK